MKQLSLAITFAISLAVGVSAQVKPNLAANNHPNTQRTSVAVPAATGSRARFSQPNANTNNQATQQWGNAPATASVQTRQVGANLSASASVARPAAAIHPVTAVLTETYRVGAGDILDIQIPDSLSTKSTLYTIDQNGMIDYPLAGGPIQVSGLTTEAIATRLKASIRVLDRPPVMVKVRDFASHSVSVIGFVHAPGAKVLRREAVPLYVVLAEAAPLDEATSVTVVRDGRNIALIDLHDPAASSQLILPGDVIKVSDQAIGSK